MQTFVDKRELATATTAATAAATAHEADVMRSYAADIREEGNAQILTATPLPSTRWTCAACDEPDNAPATTRCKLCHTGRVDASGARLGSAFVFFFFRNPVLISLMQGVGFQ
jgi:hypothetical protein